MNSAPSYGLPETDMAAPTAVYTEYASSIDAGLRLHARCAPLARPAPLLLQMHGWHGNVKVGHTDNVAPPADATRFRVDPEMRGRGDSGGWPDANGWELADAVDALDAARRLFPGAVSDAPPHLHGGSGGGGNVLGILGKFPDLFASAVCECGISDYALWYADDAKGEFRDELRDAGWVGGDPHTNPEAYLARGGRTTAMNLHTPLLIVHGEVDPRVPFAQADVYVAAVARHGRADLVDLLSLPGVGHPGHYGGITDDMEARRVTAMAAHHDGHDDAPELPQAGQLVVAGFLRTRRFEVRLDGIDHVALLAYDLTAGTFRLRAPSCRQAVVTVDDSARCIPCEPVSLAQLCAELNIPDPRDLAL